jgi:hypothetical protein
MRDTHLDKYLNQIDCESKALAWIFVSFINYYGYQMLLLILICMDDLSVKDKTRRFNFALFLTIAFIPFMIGWNIYGTILLKPIYFNPTESKAVQQYLIEHDSFLAYADTKKYG